MKLVSLGNTFSSVASCHVYDFVDIVTLTFFMLMLVASCEFARTSVRKFRSISSFSIITKSCDRLTLYVLSKRNHNYGSFEEYTHSQ